MLAVLLAVGAFEGADERVGLATGPAHLDRGDVATGGVELGTELQDGLLEGRPRAVRAHELGDSVEVNINSVFAEGVHKTKRNKLPLVVVPIYELRTGVTGLTDTTIAVALVALVGGTLKFWLFLLVDGGKGSGRVLPRVDASAGHDGTGSDRGWAGQRAQLLDQELRDLASGMSGSRRWTRHILGVAEVAVADAGVVGADVVHDAVVDVNGVDVRRVEVHVAGVDIQLAAVVVGVAMVDTEPVSVEVVLADIEVTSSVEDVAMVDIEVVSVVVVVMGDIEATGGVVDVALIGVDSVEVVLGLVDIVIVGVIAVELFLRRVIC